MAVYPAKASRYYLDLVKRVGTPLARQVIPSMEELETVYGLALDPLCEEDQSPVPGVIHRYPDRVILAVTDRCALYCRHCMRKRRIESNHPFDIEEAVAYLERTPSVRDAIISGGDPLMLDDAALLHIVSVLRKVKSIETIRIHTRIPCTLPSRVTRGLATRLSAFAPIFVNTHFNHPAELTCEAKAACGHFVDAGIPVGCQSVLLKGVNDSAETLAELFRGLLRMRVRPYYLHHPDAIAGTHHLRVDLEEGLAIYGKIRGFLSGMAVPPYMIDLPGGGGKVPVWPGMPMKRDANGWIAVKNHEGRIHRYPAAAIPTGAPVGMKNEECP